MRAYRLAHPEASLVKQPRTCEACGKSWRPWNTTIGRRARFCSIACAGMARRKPDSERVARRAVYRRDHPLGRSRDGKVMLHRIVLYDQIGPGTHACHWCGRLVTWD